jgi:hypothetical protein
MSAIIIKFPTRPRGRSIARHRLPPTEILESEKERILASQLHLQREGMIEMGISSEVIARELAAFERSVRAVLWGQCSGPRGANGQA